jgi:hypothetical protein
MHEHIAGYAYFPLAERCTGKTITASFGRLPECGQHALSESGFCLGNSDQTIIGQTQAQRNLADLDYNAAAAKWFAIIGD